MFLYWQITFEAKDIYIYIYESMSRLIYIYIYEWNSSTRTHLISGCGKKIYIMYVHIHCMYKFAIVAVESTKFTGNGNSHNGCSQYVYIIISAKVSESLFYLC